MSKTSNSGTYPDILSDGYTYSIVENLSFIPHLHKGVEGFLVSHGSVQAVIEEKKIYSSGWRCLPDHALLQT